MVNGFGIDEVIFYHRYKVDEVRDNRSWFVIHIVSV